MRRAQQRQTTEQERDAPAGELAATPEPVPTPDHSVVILYSDQDDPEALDKIADALYSLLQ